MILVAAHASVEDARVSADEPADVVGVVQRYRGEDVVASAAAHEVVGDGAVGRVLRAVPTGRPPDDLELVIVSRADDVGTGVDEPTRARMQRVLDEVDRELSRLPA